MLRHAIPIGRIFGISIDLDYSWFLVFGLVTWALAVSYYPHEFKHWGVAEYWLMGAGTAAMLFVSVLLHELGHSVVAKGYGIAVPRITLFVFGGVSEIATEPRTPDVEFWIATSGPIVSFALALVFWELQPFLVHAEPLLALAKYLAILNFVLGVFNLVPGFPLDGGRIFRSILWGITGNFRRSSSIATVTGRAFGFLLIFAGAWLALAGNLFNGLWVAFIGWFLESAAASQDQLQVVKDLLGGHKVSEVMSRDFPRIPSNVTLQELVEKNVLAQGRRSFIVGNGQGSAGLITLSTIKEVPQASWPKTMASQVMIPLNKTVSIQPGAELWTALEKMGRDGVNQLPVLNGGGGDRIVGMLSRDDLVHYLRVLQSLAK
jgi:Zn-dependent protease/predicted transcriptional regulator